MTNCIEQKYTLGFGGDTRKKRQPRRPRCRWEATIKMDLQEAG
jgi:hypothetical protein